MGWTLTSLAVQAGRFVGATGQWRGVAQVAHAREVAEHGVRPDGATVTARVYARRLEAASPADRKALEAALSELGDDAAVIERATASGAPLTAVAALAAAWHRLPDTAKETIRRPAGRGIGPVRFGSIRAVQVDRTTCGAAVMAMMLMRGDPFAAAWVATGRSLGDHLPSEAAAALEYGPRTIEERWHALQRVMHGATTSRALGVAPWPRGFGTPPWRVDDVTRYSGLRFRGAILDDTDSETMEAALAHASAALRDGIPVPLYVGGDSSGGLDQVMPRHVVLMTARTEAGLEIYEPSSGRVLPLGVDRFVEGGGKEPALGHWSRLSWMVLPRPARR
ncbi:hypothetical protein [Demequina sp. NBRC 110055]|uniref:hypothetical protein n=1 Tax=Demequina sp. NBRC 110055 TaxID=1570344 RepID=UPI0009FD4D9E|nr:hypothetical protein [Demequina sp. NBRC 110055]